MAEDTIDDFYHPYKKVKALEEHQASNALLDLYNTEYKKRYGTDPIFDPGYGHINAAKDIAKQAKEKARDLVKHYFTMNDDWFIKMSHSIECLKKSINLVNASYGKKGATHERTNQSLLISSFCDSCGLPGSFTIPMAHAKDWTLVCDPCKKKGIEPRFFGNDPIVQTIQNVRSEKDEERLAIQQE